MFAGEVDIGYIGPIPAINGYIKSNGDVKIIAGATLNGALLVTRKGLVIDDIQELAGRTVSCSSVRKHTAFMPFESAVYQWIKNY